MKKDKTADSQAFIRNNWEYSTEPYPHSVLLVAQIKAWLLHRLTMDFATRYHQARICKVVESGKAGLINETFIYSGYEEKADDKSKVGFKYTFESPIFVNEQVEGVNKYSKELADEFFKLIDFDEFLKYKAFTGYVLNKTEKGFDLIMYLGNPIPDLLLKK